MAGQTFHELSHRNTACFHLAAAGAAREELMRLGFEVPCWRDVRFTPFCTRLPENWGHLSGPPPKLA